MIFLVQQFIVIVLLTTMSEVRAQQDSKNLSFKNQNYFMKPEYIARTEYVPDAHITTDPDCAQTEVYEAALDVFKRNGGSVVGDVGCGSAYKLLKYFGNVRTIGFEVEPNFQFLVTQYPDREWRFGDFSSSTEGLPAFDIVICADVIEHLVDPDDLLNWLKRLNFRYLILSTPDKDMLPRYQVPAAQSQSGPPVNPRHIREWSFAELERYLSQYFDIQRHFHNRIEWMAQVIVATKKK